MIRYLWWIGHETNLHICMRLFRLFAKPYKIPLGLSSYAAFSGPSLSAVLSLIFPGSPGRPGLLLQYCRTRKLLIEKTYPHPRQSTCKQQLATGSLRS